MIMQPVSQPEYHAFLGRGVEGRKTEVKKGDNEDRFIPLSLFFHNPLGRPDAYVTH